MQLDLIKPGESIVGQQWFETGTHFGVEVRDPSIDKRIIEFCLATPMSVNIKNNQGRMLIRESMKGLISEEILWSTKRGLQAADVRQRIQSEKEKWIESAQAFTENSDFNEIINVKKLFNSINSLSESKQTNIKIVNTLSRGFITKKWIEQYFS